MLSALDLPLGQIPDSGWIDMQRGVGTYSTCRECNSFDGRAYVPAYRELTLGVTNALVDLSSKIGPSDEPKQISLQLQNARVGAIARQALYMLLAANENGAFGDRFPRVREILLRGTPLPLPDNMRLRLAIVTGSRIRLVPIHAQVDTATGESTMFIELAAPPLAWLLEIGPDLPGRPLEVSDWTLVAPGECRSLSITTTLGSTINSVPADYRYPSEILAAMKGQ
jgi:hypothetical protein